MRQLSTRQENHDDEQLEMIVSLVEAKGLAGPCACELDSSRAIDSLHAIDSWHAVCRTRLLVLSASVVCSPGIESDVSELYRCLTGLPCWGLVSHMSHPHLCSLMWCSTDDGMMVHG